MSADTPIQSKISSGHPQAAEQFLPLVYEELRTLAVRNMANEKPGQTLTATGLVHEAYLRLANDQRFENRGHFFAAAAQAMRHILVERARRCARLKRGGGSLRLELLDQADSLSYDPDLVLSLEDLLSKLESEDATAAKVASLHLFGGLSIDEAADALGLSRATAYRNWKYARAWLRDALKK